LLLWGGDGRKVFKHLFQTAFVFSIMNFRYLRNSVFNCHTIGIFNGTEEYSEIKDHCHVLRKRTNGSISHLGG